MRYTNVQYAERETVTVSFMNLNAAATIIDGQVVFAISQDLLTTYAANTTGQVAYINSLGVSAQTASDIFANITNPSQLVIGIAKVNSTVGNLSATGQASVPLLGIGEAVCYGFTDAIIQVRTRSGTSASWNSVAAIGAGDQLTPETVNGYLTWVATIATGTEQFPFIAAQTKASQASLAASTSQLNTNAAINATVETVRLKVRVMLM